MNNGLVIKLLLLTVLMAYQAPSLSRGVYQTSEDFISQAFDGIVPKAQTLWLKGEDKAAIEDILSHQFRRLRIRYWHQADETVWILEEIGKEKPITIGVHIQDQNIKTLKVLTFRESRGDEIRHDFFTDQFIGATIVEKNKLDRHIDGITGATMSVRATTKVARMALWLNNKIKIDT